MSGRPLRRAVGAAVLVMVIAADISAAPTAHAASWINTTPITKIDWWLAKTDIEIAGAAGVIDSMYVRLNDITHDWPRDMDVMLRGPNGQNVVLMSDSCGDPLVGAPLVISDQGESFPVTEPCSAGIYRPTNNVGEANEQCFDSTPAETLTEAFVGISPNGTWSLTACDDSPGDPMTIAGGWTLAVSLVEPPPPAQCQGADVTVDLGDGQSPTAGADVIRGTAGPDVIDAGSGDDIICGLEGDDLVQGGGGHDKIAGGAGRDTASYKSSDAPVTVSLALTGPQSTSAATGQDTLKLVERLEGGTGDDKLTGAAGANDLYGRGGDDTLLGLAGGDHLNGGGGEDSCNGGDGTDTATGCETKTRIP